MKRHHFSCVFLPLQLCLSLPLCLSTSQQPITTTHRSIQYQPNQQNLTNHHPKLKPPPQLATPPTTTSIITTSMLPPCHTQQTPKHTSVKSTTTTQQYQTTPKNHSQPPKNHCHTLKIAPTSHNNPKHPNPSTTNNHHIRSKP